MGQRESSAGVFGQRIDPSCENPRWLNLLIAVPWFIGLVFLTYSAISNHLVAKRQQNATGMITAHEPQNHDRYGFEFALNGHKYTGWGRPEKEKLEMGEVVTIYYDPRNPSKNALKSFEALSLEDFGPIPTLLLGIGALAWIVRTARRFRSSQTPG
jgi:hypothetical protein